MNIRSALQLQVMTRKRYHWDIKCEKDPATSSANFYEQIYQLRSYFYETEERNNFYERSSGHVHTSEDASNKYHNDYHDGN